MMEREHRHKHKHKKHKQHHRKEDSSDLEESWSVYKKKRKDNYEESETHSRSKRSGESSWHIENTKEIASRCYNDGGKYEKYHDQSDNEKKSKIADSEDSGLFNVKHREHRDDTKDTKYDVLYKEDSDHKTHEKCRSGDKDIHEKKCSHRDRMINDFDDNEEKEEDKDFSFDFLQYRSDINRIFFRDDEFIKRYTHIYIIIAYMYMYIHIISKYKYKYTPNT